MSKRKIKILYLGNFSDPKYEGLMTIVNNLKSNLKIVDIHLNNVTKNEDVNLINIHSSGFYESIRFQNMKGIKIYSLHANIIPLYFMRLLDYIQHMFFINIKNHDYGSLYSRFIKFLANMISNFTPIFIKRIFLNKMTVVVVPNIWLLNKLNLKNARLIRHGIDVQKFRLYEKNDRSKQNKIVVSFFGHPDSEKGIFEVINSFSKLQDNFFEKRIFLTEKNEKIENYVKGKDSSIKLFGFVNSIVKEYNNSDIVVLPYRHCLGGIATPLVLLEAMACEKAVITTDLPHLREICENTVVYVNPYSVKSIVNAIEYLARNPKIRANLGKKARNKVIEGYNQEKMFREYERLYRSLLLHNDKHMSPKPKWEW